MKQYFFKYVICILALGCMIGATSTSLAAISNPIQPMYVGIGACQPRIEINSSGTAICRDNIRVQTNYSVIVTWELQSGSTNNWSTIATWSDSGTGTIQLFEYKSVTKGYDYRLKASMKVYDSRDVLVNTPTEFSGTVHYK